MTQTKDLPAKEAQLFKQVVKSYEAKQYKKGIRAADQILKKQPEHGETLAMKGLILCYSGKREEAFELVRAGLRFDLRSHVCWHVYGLLWRNDNNYDEAMKSYKNALRADKENLQILKDLSNLQIQMRDYPGFVATRITLLSLKSAARVNWISLAIGHHLNKDYDTAIQVLTTFAGVQKEVPPGEEYEHSEMILYQALILEESGKFREAFEHLEKNAKDLKDPLGVKETKARLHLLMGEKEKAEKAYRELLDINCENHKYFSGLLECLGLPFKTEVEDAQTRDRLTAVFKEIAEQHPRSASAQRLPLVFLEGEEFKNHLERYIQRPLIKGIPSLFADLKALYRSEQKAAIIGQVFEKVYKDLQAGTAFQNPPITDSKLSPPGEASLWTKIFLAGHYDRIGQTEKALGFIEECLKEQPEELECYCVKRRILKHAGDLEGAIEAACLAQELDSSDRYLNSVAAKTIFRAGHVVEGDEMATVFTKASEQANYLYEMQCVWYEIESGSAYYREQNYGKALKHFLAVIQHFAAYEEDQFDFHAYCTRKLTLRSYISMLRMEDDIYKEKLYAKAAQLAVQVYIDLADAPGHQEQQEKDEEALLASLSLEDRKKHKLKKKKEAQKKAKAQEQQKLAAEQAAKEQAAKNKGKTEKASKADADPDGAKLASVEDPLQEASKLLQKLRENHPDDLKTHLLSFEVALRRGKDLLALQAVNKAKQLVGVSHPKVHDIIVRFALKAAPEKKAEPKTNGVSKDSDGGALGVEIVKKHLANLLGGDSIQSWHERFVKEHANSSLMHNYTAAKISALLQPSGKQEAFQSFLQRSRQSGQGDLKQCQEVHRLLKTELRSQSAAEEFFADSQSRFPYSTYFQGSKASPKYTIKAIKPAKAAAKLQDQLRADSLKTDD